MAKLCPTLRSGANCDQFLRFGAHWKHVLSKGCVGRRLTELEWNNLTSHTHFVIWILSTGSCVVSRQEIATCKEDVGSEASGDCGFVFAIHALSCFASALLLKAACKRTLTSVLLQMLLITPQTTAESQQTHVTTCFIHSGFDVPRQHCVIEHTPVPHPDMTCLTDAVHGDEL